ncbi:hypothetical protein C6P40_000840 [Pichia californica]|uniref:Uncharacterized protein n=1 Tax=Pichia californica TaxID=460514 RepID=A0A9P6WKH4_9ASCO|nr:hypothetical protein C6P42_004188 [[Candida] californica]KAG0688544.1 hypothetical protein C6P40_000840 [[Candida] californica]
MNNTNIYYYVNGKISTCRRCKRKRTLDEDPDHLQFKTCFRCRMIERDQKKFNQAKRKLNADANAGNRPNPTREEIEQLAEHLKNTSKAYQAASKQFNPTATSAPTKISVPTLNKNSAFTNNNINVTKDIKITNTIPSTFQFKNNIVPAKNTFVADPLNFQSQSFDQTLAMLENTEIQLDDDAVDVDLAYNEQLFSFNILSIDPKLNPLTLTAEQQSLLQLSFLAKYHHDQSSNYKVAPHALSPTQANLCLSCKTVLQKHRLGKQICEDCESKQSILKDFNHYLTILKLNKTQDLYRIIFMTKISLDELLKSSLSDNKSSQNVLKLLYDKYVVPINEITNAEFLLPNINNDSTDETILKKVLKCASDHSGVSFTDSAIDPEALNLSTIDSINHATSIPIECKFSQLCLNYDMNTGDLVISFSHSCHL